MEFHPDKPLPLRYKKAAPENYFVVETQWMPAEGYAESDKATLREIAVRTILRSSKLDNMDPSVPYLAVNFFDRFNSSNEIPHVQGGLENDLDLVAHACLLLAWWMRDIVSITLPEFARKRKLKLENLIKVEPKIAVAIKWRLTITPLSFVGFFVQKMPQGKGIRYRTINKIIMETQDDISFTRFRPSVIAASAVLSACSRLYSNEYDRNQHILLTSVGEYLDLEKLEECLKKTQEMCFAKQLRMEKVEGTSKIGEKEAMEVVGEKEGTEVGETSSSASRRAGKEPMVEEEGGERKIDPEQDLNFELEWMKWRSEEIAGAGGLDSPKYRTPAPPEEPKVSWTDPRFQHYGLCGICRSYGYCTSTNCCNLL